MPHEDDRSQLWAIEKPEKISPVTPAEVVTEVMPVNHGTVPAVSFQADESHEDEQRQADRKP